MPNLIYVSREKSRTAPHHFKAGALNVLVSFIKNTQNILLPFYYSSPFSSLKDQYVFHIIIGIKNATYTEKYTREPMLCCKDTTITLAFSI